MGGFCRQCGADQRYGTCGTLFRRLLALQYLDDAPYAEHRTLAIACFALQHPDHPVDESTVTEFLDHGLESVHMLAERGDATDDPRALPDLPTAPASARGYTIVDLSVDGSFPEGGYAERVAAWIRAATIAPDPVEV